MGLIYSVDAALMSRLNAQLMERLLQRGKQLGLRYFEQTLSASSQSQELSPQEAARILMKINSQTDPDEVAIDAIFDRSNFGLAIYEKNPGYTIVDFMAIDGDTEMKSGYRMDYDRFIRLMLDMIKDLPIIKLEASSF